MGEHELQTTTKSRLEITNPPGVTASSVPGEAVSVNAVKVGAVNFGDKLKGYYHTLIVLVGAVIILLNQLSSALGWIPDYGQKIAVWISIALGVLTVLLTALKSNESWVDDL